MEYELLAKVGYIVNVFVSGGYVVAGSYLVRTGIRYVTDYKDSVEKEGIK